MWRTGPIPAAHLPPNNPLSLLLPWNLRSRIFSMSCVAFFLEPPSRRVSFSTMAYSSTPS